ncbi:virB8 family protein [Asticcacaulis tiandongensis]|uniref:virB8 family protein n=1 Tax=Asticcacaulis tiandongensis TaxID=2565365 RepID=UPI00112BF2D3|nr:type IV secretion system protein [Asticcacaulis tiandongensis]
MLKRTVQPEQAQAFFGAGLDWESDRLARIERSEKRAWLITFVLCLITAILVVAIVSLLPLKRVVPYVYSIDKQTGQLTLMDAAGQRQITASQDVLDKHFTNAYVLAHESYDWKLLQTDFDNTVAFSAPRVAQAYAARFSGENAVNKVWGPTIERKVTITSIQLAPDAVSQKAVVRYRVQQRDLQTNNLATPESYIATLTYEYHPQRTGKEQDLIKNPLGFTVTAFRADPEIGGVPVNLPGTEGVR